MHPDVGRLGVRRLAVVIFAVFALRSTDARATEPPSPPVDAGARAHVGLEANIVPYFLGGYHADAWAGIDGWRGRAILARTVGPAFVEPKGFHELQVNFYEVEVDRFFGRSAAEFRGLWVAAGFGYSHSTIREDGSEARGTSNSFDFHAGSGWAFSLPLGFYVSPWVGATVHLTSPTEVTVGATSWHPSRFSPEASVKLGWDYAL